MEPKFFVVATPIGNRDDITVRALEILGSVDFIVAEDTRHTGQLMALYGIKKPYISFRDAPEQVMSRAIDAVLERLKQGETGAYVTDAGTPGVSDPGWRLVRSLLDGSVALTAVPGPSAVTLLLSLVDVAIVDYRFCGFLPKKKGFQTKIHDLVTYLDHKEARAVLFYESPNRIRATLREFLMHSSGLYAVVGRELTKKFETIYRGTLTTDFINAIEDRGEFVVLLTRV